MIEQRILNFNTNKNYESDYFFVSNSNKNAYSFLLDKKNVERYIYLKGPSKSGKTHLGLLWQEINNAILFKNDNYDIILNQNNNIFYDDFSLNLNEEKLFHIINHCYNNNLKMLITSNLFPSKWCFKIKDLSSRIKSFHLIEIKNPDDELLNNILMKLLYDRQIIVKNKEIFFYITNRINRTYLDLYNFVEKIDKLSLSKKRELTIPLIKELL